MKKILKYVVYDTIRSKVIIAYTLILLLITAGFLYMQADMAKTIISLLNVVLIIVPLICIILGSISYYNSREFIELLMAQPIRRRNIFFSHYLGLASVLALAFLLGVGLPLLLNGINTAAIYLLINGVLLSYIFTAIAFLASVYSNDKARGIGLSLILWFYFSIVYDGIVLAILFYFSDYPLEKPVLAFTALNPVDLGRIVIMMNLDISALMGYTGALYHKFFGSSTGIIIALGGMFTWLALPALWAKRKFVRKDF